MRLLLQQAKPLMEMPCLADPTCVLIDTTRSVSYHHSTNMRHLAASPSACLLLPRMTCPTDLALRPLPARGGSQAIQRDDDAAGAHEHAVTHLWRLFDAEGLRGEDPFLGIQYNLPITASVHAACLTGRAPPSVSYSLPRPLRSPSRRPTCSVALAPSSWRWPTSTSSCLSTSGTSSGSTQSCSTPSMTPARPRSTWR